MDQLKQQERIWLPHLINSIPKEAYGHSISMYCVALEGWRRGLNLTFRNYNTAKSNTVFFLSDGKKKHRFVVTKGDKVEQEASTICKNKYLTKQYLLKAGVPTQEGKLFDDDFNDFDIINYANKLGYPVVIKPLSGSGGKGVIANIQDELELQNALKYVLNELNIKEVLVEKHFEGIDCRVFVLDGKVIGAIKRIPANVIGDGKSSIKTLINLKQKRRFENPALFGRKINIDNEVIQVLAEQGYTIESVPKQGDKVLLKTKNNISAGGDAVDITDELTEKIKGIAIDAANAIPGLAHCGVDLIVDLENDTATVIEINSQPHIASQMFPEMGQGRNIPKAIIDYYFPETKANYKKPLYYFDFEHVWKLFRKGSAQEIFIPNIPQGDLKSIKIAITGQIQNEDFSNWIKYLAQKFNINGYLKFLTNEKCVIVCSGEVNSVIEFKKIIYTESTKKTFIEKINEKTYNEPIKIGFEILKQEKAKSLKNLKKNSQSNINEHLQKDKKKNSGIIFAVKRLFNKILKKIYK